MYEVVKKGINGDIMNKIMISVIMPAYNCEKYIGEAIASVLKQKVNFELLIIDDGSKDHTKDVITQYLQDDRVNYIYNETNMGVAKTRNRGIELAKGKYIAFLDADDYWMEDKLEKQLKLMEEKQAVLSSTARELVDEHSNSLGRVLEIEKEISYKDLLKGNVINTSGVMILTEVARQYPMVQDHLHEDYIMWLSILKHYKRVYGINEPLLKYRIMKGTKSANKLKSAKMTFGVYRYIGLSFIKSCYYFCFYAVNGLKKYHGT